jgi:hypothetical protein
VAAQGNRSDKETDIGNRHWKAAPFALPSKNGHKNHSFHASSTLQCQIIILCLTCHVDFVLIPKILKIKKKFLHKTLFLF